MGLIFQRLKSHITDVPPDSIFVEIGSDRYEGSTEELNRLAGMYQTRLITVDILPEASKRLSRQLTNTEFVVAAGAQWTRDYSGPPIACLYLDNFDYMWSVDEQYTNEHIRRQLEDYRLLGLQMTNQNCQQEHMSQMIGLYPHLTQDAVVMFDDTYLLNDCWIGKCGPAVVYLQAQGWTVVEQTTDCGVIMKKI